MPTAANSDVNLVQYDVLGRRIVKQVKNSADLDCTYHSYYNGQSVVETRNGSDEVLKQQVWGTGYVDELVQIGINNDPADTEQNCESFYWTCQDANYNVLGLVDSNGVLAERYEYTPYGQRTVFFSAGANDVGCYSMTYASRPTANGLGLCEFGHQGLMHDEESGLVYNRARMLHPGLGKFVRPPQIFRRSRLPALVEHPRRPRGQPSGR